MSISYRIAQIQDSEVIYQFAEDKLRSDLKQAPKDSQSLHFEMNEMDFMMKIWESRFRKEALEHYLKLGWSFMAYEQQGEKEILKGFFLGQPFLFFEGQTQTLWVELIMALDYKIEAELTEIAYKLSRDKHFQKVILPSSVTTLHFDKSLPFQKWSNDYVWLKTTK